MYHINKNLDCFRAFTCCFVILTWDLDLEYGTSVYMYVDIATQFLQFYAKVQKMWGREK